MKPFVAGALVAASLLPRFALPAAVTRWLHSPRQQVAAGIERLEAGDAPAAAQHFDRAAELRPDDPRALFDAGTGRLAAGRRDAAEPLQRAAEMLAESGAGATERSPALYNLGNARLAAGQAAGAVDAFEECLRLEPGHQDAKHNLELALHELEQQRRQAKTPQEAPGGKRQGERQPGSGEGPGEESPEPRPGAAQQPGGEDPQPGRQGPPQPGERPLPRFEEQPDMTAAQAAALLEAVENRERQARRLEAQQRAAQRPVTENDW